MPKKQTKKNKQSLRRSNRIKQKQVKKVLIMREETMKDFLKQLEQLNKCRIKHCRRYGRSNKSDTCVKKKCKGKLTSVNKKNKDYLASFN